MVRAVIDRVGELAALGTAGCWVISALAFERAGKRIGSLSLNLIRLVLALVPLSLWGLATRGHALPVDASAGSWAWLSLSALIGLVLGDLCLFRAFVLIGPRLATLIMASTPVWTTLFGFLVLGEVLGPRELLGVGLCIAGIGWAVSGRSPTPVQPEPKPEPEPEPEPEPRPAGAWRFASNGVILALAGAVGQAGGLVTSKLGMGDYDPFAATQIRVLAAIVGFAVLITAWGWWPRVSEAVRDRQAMAPASLGALAGPFLGVGLSLLAVQLAPTGIAASLMATTPILMLPVSWIRGEPVGVAGLLGALLAVAGVAILLA
jgi:drug/metabolite transporter (DMT)-like permease